MKALIQRVTQASVTVKNVVNDRTVEQQVGAIAHGLLLFLGIEQDDDEQIAQRLLDKVLRYRVFPDQSGRMNRSLLDAGGDLLVVSQFTLVADTQKGLRPSFSSAAPPAQGERLCHFFITQARLSLATVETGRFGADMSVELVNDGPVTFMLDVSKP